MSPTLSSNIATTQSHFSSYLTSTNLNVMSNYKLTEKELLDAVSLLKPNKSLGFDDISSNVIIKSIKQITIPLLHIFNLSLKQGVFSDNLKIAKVIPVLKSGDPSDVTNYRPISILSCFSKILERVMYNRLYSFLNVNNILFHKQFGFKSGHSTDHAITHLVHDIFKGFDEDKYTLGVFIDLSKAFDTVNHQILLSKLKSYDDTNLFYSSKDISKLFQTVNKELEKLTQWFKSNKLSLNISKSKYTLFHRLHKKQDIPLKLPDLFIDNALLKREQSIKFLGVVLDENLTWRDHIGLIENKISKNIDHSFEEKAIFNFSVKDVCYQRYFIK
ncbi:uncharacterized protein LOC136087141 [Hydra vulgaris]|uniref:Uncharacterized protein LOC136087141 n=1 Tax=Hydra vulgaris TaxID=6087 RepID=A0ABM4CUW2_HYDVU